jgi:hypothetical protein
MSNIEDKKQKEYMDFLGKGIEEKNLYIENTRPSILVDEPYKTIHSLRVEALKNISLENFNKLLQDKQQFKNNHNYGKCITEYKYYHKEKKDNVIIPEGTTIFSHIQDVLVNATSPVVHTASAFRSAYEYAFGSLSNLASTKGGRKSLKIKRSARHKKSHSKSIKRRKRSKK